MTLADRVAGRHGATDLLAIAPGSHEHRRIVDILAEAYPTSRLDTTAKRDASFVEQREFALRSSEHALFGAFRDGALVGTMRVYDFCVNVRGAQIAAAGIGSLAVALESKRRGVARDCVLAVLDAAREAGVPLATLYAFRADFYAAFGFGPGAKLDQYRLRPDVFPARGSRERVRRLHITDADCYGALHARLQARMHGLFRRERWRTEMRLESPSLLTFGYDEGGGIGGSLTVEIKLGADGTWNRNELVVHELAYESPAALHGLLAFLNSQSDQFGTIVMNTVDPDLHVLFADARNGTDHNLFSPVYNETNTQGIGLMYRVVDVAAMFEALGGARFATLDATVRFDTADAQRPGPPAPVVVVFRAGQPTVVDLRGSADVDIAIDIADLSALLMGTVRLHSLVAYGRAVVSAPSWIAPLDAAFTTVAPQCFTRF